jgi:hypothetical protein
MMAKEWFVGGLTKKQVTELQKIWNQKKLNK